MPDEIFELALRHAAELGISRSEFISQVVRRYLDELAADSLRSRIDLASHIVEDDESTSAAVTLGRRQLGDGQDW